MIGQIFTDKDFLDFIALYGIDFVNINDLSPYQVQLFQKIKNMNMK